MKIVQGYNPDRVIPQMALQKVRGVTVLEKLGNNIYVYPDELNSEVKCSVQILPVLELNPWLDSFNELDGFYCINCITGTVNYLGSQWEDVIWGLKFRQLAA